ncbi:hypothetical protein MBLNU230_g1818t1 [Neophaeotheca triangularis]
MDSTTTCPDTSTLFTSGQMAGLALGLALPLLTALITTLLLLRKERSRNSRGPKLMYKLPDNHNDSAFTFHQPNTAFSRPGTAFSYSHDAPAATNSVVLPGSALGSTSSLKTPAHVQVFMDRCASPAGLGHKGGERGLSQTNVVELDGAPPRQEVQRFELGDGRMSK